MPKVMRLINGVPRSISIDQEVSIGSAASSLAVSFPATLQTASSTPRVVAWMVNTTDTDAQIQPVEITVRSSSGFTATWNAPTSTANYKLAYIVPDGFIV